MPFTMPARRLATVGFVAAVTLAGLATGASAHVTANPSTAEQGSYAKVSFRVPNERDDAGTVKLQIDLPMDHPVTSVSVRPVPGWDVQIEKGKLAKPIKKDGSTLTEAVSRITWTGGEIAPGRFQEFDVSMGPLPTGTDRLLFTAVQTYSSGEVVRWDQAPGKDGAEPEHPAPMLELTPAKGGGAAAAHQAAATGTSGEPGGGDGTARAIGAAGVGVGVIGLGLGGYGLSLARRRA